jgi:beta-galactosidase
MSSPRPRIAALLLLLLACKSSSPGPLDPPRVTLDLDEGWMFLRGDPPAAETPGMEEVGWAPIRVPHTWNAVDGQDGGNDYYRGPGWYRRRVSVPAALAGRRLFLQFDAASTVADVWVNGAHVGQHRGAFARFRFDVTDSLRAGDDNVVAVRVSNAATTDIPPLVGDFTLFGGLHRHVSLLVTDPVHVGALDHGASGIYLTAREVSAASASLEARVTVTNDDRVDHIVAVRTVVRDGAGQVVATLSAHQPLAAGTSAVVVSTGSVPHPHLWNGRLDPYLHAVSVEVHAENQLRDLVTVPFGFRSFAITPDRGFSLNGQPYDLHGVARHQDRQGRGWALGDADQDQDMTLITEVGATAVRLTHYQQGERIYDLADRAGIILWSELPLVGASNQDPAFAENARQQLRELIRQNYNHPSVVVWGLANELIDFVPTDPDPLVSELDALAHAEDSTRPTTLASHLPDSFAIGKQTDVVGMNRFFGWYSGKVGDLAAWADGVRAALPGRAVALSEYGAGASVRFHVAPVGTADHTEEYQATYHEEAWKILAARPFLWARFTTFMFDAASDGRNEGDQPGRNDKGLVTYDRAVRKDAFFWYKANWSADPFVHITSRRFEPRTEATIEVKVYSNQATVSLTVNGQPFGAVSAPDHIFRWAAVPLVPGPNLVEARAEGGLRDSVSWTLSDHGAPAGPAPLSNRCTTLVNDGPAVPLMNPSTDIPPMTGGPLTDGVYVFTESRNVPTSPFVLRSKFQISEGGTRIQYLEGATTTPERTAAGVVTTSGNVLVRGFVCPGTTTLVSRYTATPTSIQLLDFRGPLAVFTRQ